MAHYILFTKRSIDLKVSAGIDKPEQLGWHYITLNNFNGQVDLCMVSGESDRVNAIFNSLKTRPDLLVHELLSGEMDLPDSSVNAWIWKQFSRRMVNTNYRLPSH